MTRSKATRLDIQVLRAVAVMMVLLTHLWPARLPGGYAGVDVFFVISGFLITTHLLKEIRYTGRINLPRFYARRLRRLLPASCLVLLVSMLAMIVFLPSDSWSRNLSEMVAATFYVENLYLTNAAIDYHAQNAGESLVQHYWSLSLEEQFYLLWPGLLLLATMLVKSSNSEECYQRRRKTILLTVMAIIVLSFGFNYWFTGFSQNQAYFFTPTRFWELGVGSFLAIVADSLAGFRPAAGVYCVLAGLGWGGIALSNYWLTATTPFPGIAALLPVCSTAILVGLGITQGAERRAIVHYLYRWRWLQYLGDISYSLYLWHWPLLLITKAALGRDIFYYEKIVVAAVTFICASACKRFVEDPSRQTPLFSRSLKRTFLPTLCVMVLVSLCWAGGNYWVERIEIRKEQNLKAVLRESCVGANSMVNSKCKNQHTAIKIDVSTEQAVYYRHDKQCRVEFPQEGAKPAVVLCDYSKSSGNKKVGKQENVVVVGDSHAEQWSHALEDIGKRRGWKIHYMLKAGCPLVPLKYYSEAMEAGRAANDRCGDAVKAILEYVKRNDFDRVIQSGYLQSLEISSPALQHLKDGDERWKIALADLWKEWNDSGKTVTVIGDTPRNDDVRDLNCISTNAKNPIACAVDREKAIGHERLRDAAIAFRKVNLVDMTRFFCDESKCYAGLGGVQLYYDTTHISGIYSKQLAPYLEEQLKPVK